MRIAVYGAGATGSHLAVKLARAGHAVSVVARGAHLGAIRAGGLMLRVGGDALSATVRASADPGELGVQDVVLVTVKATDLEAVAAGLPPLVSSQTAVVFSQNGMPWWYPLDLAGKPPPPDLPNFRLGAAFLACLAPGQVVGGSLFSGNQVVAPGVVNNTTPDRNRLDIAAAAPAATVDVVALRAMLEAAGIASPPVEGDIRAAIWAKLLYNMTASTIALATGAPSSVSRRDAALGEVFVRIMTEGMAIAAAHGFPMEGRVDPVRMLGQLPEHKPSLLQDYEQRRPMEIAEIVRAPLAFARSAGVATPSFDVLAAIVTRLAIERGLTAPECRIPLGSEFL